MGNYLNSTPFRDNETQFQDVEENLMFGGPPTQGPNSILNQNQMEFFTNNVKLKISKILVN